VTAPDGMAQLIIEAGFAPADPALSSGVLILDDPVAGLLNTGTLADDDTWTDISPPLAQSLTVTRGSTREQGPVITWEGGTAAVTFDNSDARFLPENLAGPYVAAGITQVRPMIPVRARAAWNGITYPLFRGFAQSWDPGEDQGPDYATTTLTAADGFLVLAGVTLPEAAPAGANELSGARVQRILAAAGWYDAARGMSTVSAGSSQMQATTLGSPALDLLQLAAASEIGAVYVDESGSLVFRGRHDVLTNPRSATVQAVFGDRPGTVQADGTEMHYSAVTVPPADLSLANDIQATRQGGALQEVTDAASVRRYLFKRTYSRSDLLLTTDAETLNWAQYVAWITAGGNPEFDSVTLTPSYDPDGLWPLALGLQMGDRIQVWRRPPGMATPITRDCLIRGITHTVGAGTWETTFSLQDASRYSFFTLDSAILGALDANALAF
jgi:hypothetical protein